MRFSATFAALAITVASVLAAPSSLINVQTYKGETNGKYIVKFKSGVSPKTYVKQLGLINSVQVNAINGLASTLSKDHLNTLRSSADVEYIAEDGIMHITDTVTQTDAPWGLNRISAATAITPKDASLLSYSYTYDDSAGAGVDIYVVDTGIFVNHTQFIGRARWGFSASGFGNVDGHGHGTHVSGTAAGKQFGVAKKASLIAVKVLSDGGSGSVSGIVTGLNWVKDQAAASGRPSIVSMSLGGGASTPLDDAVASLTAAGVHVAVAAGNSNDDAQFYSPARSPTAVTVGASDINDARAFFSNYGALVDIFAPGLDVISSWIGSDTATNSISGTSMATPHISGLIAYFLGKEPTLTPAQIVTKIQSLSVKGVLTNIPSGTINDLAQNA